jgi:hypothetical protein
MRNPEPPVAEEIQNPEAPQMEGSAQRAAPGGWFDCEVIRVGPAEDGKIYIGLRPLAGQWPGWRWYSAVSTQRKEMLATALTAITNELHVTVALSTTDAYGTINRCYVARDV